MRSRRSLVAIAPASLSLLPGSNDQMLLSIPKLEESVIISVFISQITFILPSTYREYFTGNRGPLLKELTIEKMLAEVLVTVKELSREVNF
ncbi:unnamed protein product [Arctogadus glacialis]